MALETGTYIGDLVASNPAAGDSGGQGDDHLRLIKEILQNTFPTANKIFNFPTSIAAQAGNYSPNANTSDGLTIPMDARSAARTVTLPATPGFDGLRMRIVKADHSINTVTINGNGHNINGSSTLILHQRYQGADLIYCATTAEWFAVVDEIPPVGLEAPYAGGTAPPGYVLMSGRTLGNGVSGATERANADCLALYQLLWNTYSNTIIPVAGGRGASALADFDAGKVMTLLSARGRAIFGDDNMGGTTAGNITTANSGIDGTSLGATGGVDGYSFDRAQFPNVTLSVTGTTNSHSGHEHPLDHGDGGFVAQAGGGGATAANLTNSETGTAGAHSHTVTATTASVNGGVTQIKTNNMPPAIIQTYLIKY